MSVAENFEIFTLSNIRSWLERGEDVRIDDCTTEIIKVLEREMDLIHFASVSEYGEEMEMVRINK